VAILKYIKHTIISLVELPFFKHKNLLTDKIKKSNAKLSVVIQTEDDRK